MSELIKCKSCNTEIKKKSKFCSNCGSVVKTKIKCSSCNYINENSSKFCANCGNEIKSDNDVNFEQKKPKLYW